MLVGKRENDGWRSSSFNTRSPAWGTAQEAPLSTAIMTRPALKVFKRWMISERSDTRSIEDIQPKELDGILANFFTSVMAKDGRDYSAKSLKAFREGLKRHLENCGYHLSVTTSREFTLCQLAYKQKYQNLLQRAIKKKEQPKMSNWTRWMPTNRFEWKSMFGFIFQCNKVFPCKSVDTIIQLRKFKKKKKRQPRLKIFYEKR